jgi:hypothetical protein
MDSKRIIGKNQVHLLQVHLFKRIGEKRIGTSILEKS